LITRDTIARIIDIARIEEVVGDVVRLKRKSANFEGLCPFHNEKTPSFVVSPAKNIFKCFGCGKAGGPLTFVMEHDKLTYPEALKALALKYNITIEEKEISLEEQKQLQEKDSLYIINEFALKYFKENLHNTEEGITIALPYFSDRGLTIETMHKFQLGWSSNASSNLAERAKANGYNIDLLRKVGLITLNTQHTIDFFRERLIFPIHNVQGKVVAFAGRVIKKNDKSPKYINSPETEIYNKSQTLYGLHLAKNAIIKADVCLLVEGYMDVISLVHHGIENVVASSGTSLTTEQIKLIKRYTQNIYILYDSDHAGIKAADRGIDLILEHDMNVRIVQFPEGEDPDSYAQKNGSLLTTTYINQNANDFILFRSKRSAQEIKNNPIKKAELLGTICNTIAKIPDSIKRSVYIKECAFILEIDEKILINETNKLRKNILHDRQKNIEEIAETYNDLDVLHQINKLEIDATQITKTSSLSYIERQIIRLLAESGNKMYDESESVSSIIFSYFQDNNFIDKEIQKTFNYLLTLYQQHHLIPTLSEMIRVEDESVYTMLVNLLLEKYTYSENWDKKFHIITLSPQENFKLDILELINMFQYRKLEQMISETQSKLKDELSIKEQHDTLAYIQELLNQKKEIAKFLSINI